MDKCLIVCALFVFIPLIWCQCFTGNDAVILSADKLYYGQRKFSVNLLNSLQRSRQNESVFFSPHSTYRALLLAYFGARGLTEKSLQKTLQLDWAKSKADVRYAYELERRARVKRTQHQTIEFHSVDKLYFSTQVQVKHCIRDMFDESIDVLDFESEPELCRIRINEFIENITKNNIRDLLPAGSIKTDTNMVLANAASFKGIWMTKFDKGNTKKKIFYQHGQLPVYVEMMKQKGNFNYGVVDRLKTAFLEMPYQGEHGSISMFVLLPVFTPNAINELLKSITPEVLDEVLSKQSIEEEVTVEFPKISFERKFKLVPILKSMGIGDLFDGTADLSEFSEDPLKFDDATHQAKILIDEEGSVASAATAFFQPGRTRLAGPIQFICNHPFMFLIHDRKSKEILFSGVYRGPNQ